MQKRKVIGFDRKIEKEWLDAVLDRFATGSTLAEARTSLHDLLSPTHPGKAARQKTLGILVRLWFLPVKDHAVIRNDVLELVPSLPARDRLWLHWGMATVTYPFFRDTAAAVGRLLKLQGE